MVRARRITCSSPCFTLASPSGRNLRRRSQRRRWRRESFVPFFSLVLIWLCISRNETSPAVWLSVLLIDLVAVGVALVTSSFRSLSIALFGTVVAAGFGSMTGSSHIDDLNAFLGVTTGFGIFFFSAAMFLVDGLPLRPNARNVSFQHWRQFCHSFFC